MAPIQKNGILHLDDQSGVLTEMTGVVAFSCNVQQTLGRYGLLPAKWENTMDGRRKFAGQLRGLAETSAGAAQLRSICRAWMLSADKPGPKTFKMQIPDDQPGSEEFMGEIRITNLDPLVDADAMSDDALVTTISYEGDGALTYAVIV